MTSDSEHKPKLYNQPIPLSDLTFEELLKLLEPRITFNIRKNYDQDTGKCRVPGFDKDDLRQELWIKIYTILKNNKLPKDMVNFDYRFLRYIDFIFNNTIISLWRKTMWTVDGKNHSVHRDLLNDCQRLGEESLLDVE